MKARGCHFRAVHVAFFNLIDYRAKTNKKRKLKGFLRFFPPLLSVPCLLVLCCVCVFMSCFANMLFLFCNILCVLTLVR